MKICLVADSLPTFHKVWSGAEVVCMRLAEALERNGEEVLFLTTKFDFQNNSSAYKVYQIRNPLGLISSYTKTFPLNLFAFFHSFSLLIRLKPDIVHFHAKELFLPVLISAKLLNIKVAYTVLDYHLICPKNILLKPNGDICTEFQDTHCFIRCDDVFSLKKFPTTIKKPLRRFISWLRFIVYDFFAKKIDAVIVLSNTSKNRLIQYGIPKEKNHVIYHYQVKQDTPIKLSFISQFDNHKILFVGSLSRHKGLHIIIEAIPGIIKEIPDTRLIVVIGETVEEYKSKIENLIEELGIKRNVEFLGKRTNEEVLQLIRECDVVVVPEQWPNDFGPVILVEAMSLGKPIVASRIGGIPEFINDGVSGFLIAHNAPMAFTEKIIFLLKNKNQAQRIGKNAQESVKDLLNKEFGNDVLDVYRRILKK